MMPLKIMTALIIWIGCSSCTSTKYLNTHVNVEIDDPCVFEKYTLEEKQSMTRQVGERTLRNQDSCRIRSNKNNAIINAHNELHNN